MDFAGLTITIGCPGSGKSTWADRNLPATTARLERDRFREAIFGNRRAYHESPLERGIRSHVITQAMGATMSSWPEDSWAVTDTGLAYAALSPFIDFASRYIAFNCPIRLIVFERSPSYLRTCNRIRPEAHRVPDDVLETCIEQFFAEDAWWRSSPYEKHYAYRLPATDAA